MALKRSRIRRARRGETPATKYEAEVADERAAWANSMPQRCMLCGRPFDGSLHYRSVHEILSRAQAPGAWWFPANGLLLGMEPCHSAVQTWPVEKQLALKSIADPANYSLEEWLRVKGRGRELPLSVWAADVGEWLTGDRTKETTA